MTEFYLSPPLEQRDLETPAYVYDLRRIDRDIDEAQRAVEAPNSRLFYALKAFMFGDVVTHIGERVDGLHASSLYEARLADEVARRCDETPDIHLTTPGLRPDEIEELAEICRYVSLNSLGHLRRFGPTIATTSSVGLRVNPRMSFVDDERYDPCRRHSKLGVPVDRVDEALAEMPAEFDGVEGLLVHSNCDEEDLEPLLKTVRLLVDRLDPLLRRLDWLNLGGGYLFRDGQDRAPVRRALDLLGRYENLEVLFEPGSSIVRRGGRVVATVLDRFESEGREMAVLDTSVNHIPEAFDYDYHHPIRDEREEGEHTYLLAGATCLAGDLFGAYRFDRELEVGSRVVFEETGSYSFVLAHTFNGVALPTLYTVDADGELERIREFDYDDYRRRHTRIPVPAHTD